MSKSENLHFYLFLNKYYKERTSLRYVCPPGSNGSTVSQSYSKSKLVNCTSQSFSTVAENQSYSKCGGCNEEIRDKYLLQALDKLWHVYCLRCSDCRETLSDDGKCYVRDGNILCDFDFFR